MYMYCTILEVIGWSYPPLTRESPNKTEHKSQKSTTSKKKKIKILDLDAETQG